MEAAAVSLSPRRSAGRLLRAAGDDRLLARLRAGDDAAFEVIYDRHHAALLAFCRHMLGSQEEAEDALQQVFMCAHRSLRVDQRAIQLKPWLYAIARNRCLSMLRVRRQAVVLDDVVQPSTDGLAVETEVEQRQDLRELLGDLAGLPDDQRAALLLAELEDLSHEQIAEALDVRREKVKALVFQARESLMNTRQAREADCHDIQEQLASLRGGSLRRTQLSRHVSGCPDCAAFKAEVQRQKAAMALLLPVLPGQMLKSSILAGIFGGGGGGGGATLVAGGAASAGGGSLLSGGLMAKGLAVAALAGSVGGGGVIAVRQLDHSRPVAAKASAARSAGSDAAGRAVISRPGVAPKTASPSSGKANGLAAAPGHRKPAGQRGTVGGARAKGTSRSVAKRHANGAANSRKNSQSGSATASGQLAKSIDAGVSKRVGFVRRSAVGKRTSTKPATVKPPSSGRRSSPSTRADTPSGTPSARAPSTSSP
jgi:RNA polymerase sigma factor (sigma-70 family)